MTGAFVKWELQSNVTPIVIKKFLPLFLNKSHKSSESLPVSFSFSTAKTIDNSGNTRSKEFFSTVIYYPLYAESIDGSAGVLWLIDKVTLCSCLESGLAGVIHFWLSLLLTSTGLIWMLLRTHCVLSISSYWYLMMLMTKQCLNSGNSSSYHKNILQRKMLLRDVNIDWI